jgi:hypothetical protein
MKRDPQPATGSRSRTLLNNLNAYTEMLSKYKQTHGDYYKRVDDGIRDLVWEYRKRLSGKSATDFENKLMQLRSMSTEQIMKERLFAGEQHL